MVKTPRVTQLSVALPQEMAQAIYQQVRNGTYGSASELMRDAVRQLLKLDEAESEQAPPSDPNRRPPRTGARQRSG